MWQAIQYDGACRCSRCRERADVRAEIARLQRLLESPHLECASEAGARIARDAMNAFRGERSADV